MKHYEHERRRRRAPDELNGKGGDHSANRVNRDPLFTVRMNKEFFDSVNQWINEKTELDGTTKKDLVLELFTKAITEDLEERKAEKLEAAQPKQDQPQLVH